MDIVYWAGPLFTQAERDWNARIANGLRDAGLTVILPQERAEEVTRPGEALPARRLYEYAVEGVRAADVVVAVLDGPDPDSGTSFECGYAHALGKPFVGLRTDFRMGGDDSAFSVNLMLSQSAAACVRVTSEDLQDVVDSVLKAIASVASAV